MAESTTVMHEIICDIRGIVSPHVIMQHPRFKGSVKAFAEASEWLVENHLAVRHPCGGLQAYDQRSELMMPKEVRKPKEPTPKATCVAKKPATPKPKKIGETPRETKARVKALEVCARVAILVEGGMPIIKAFKHEKYLGWANMKARMPEEWNKIKRIVQKRDEEEAARNVLRMDEAIKNIESGMNFSRAWLAAGFHSKFSSHRVSPEDMARMVQAQKKALGRESQSLGSQPESAEAEADQVKTDVNA